MATDKSKQTSPSSLIHQDARDALFAGAALATTYSDKPARAAASLNHALGSMGVFREPSPDQAWSPADAVTYSFSTVMSEALFGWPMTTTQAAIGRAITKEILEG